MQLVWKFLPQLLIPKDNALHKNYILKLYSCLINVWFNILRNKLFQIENVSGYLHQTLNYNVTILRYNAVLFHNSKKFHKQTTYLIKENEWKNLVKNPVQNNDKKKTLKYNPRQEEAKNTKSSESLRDNDICGRVIRENRTKVKEKNTFH